ncbi:MAG: dihydroorotate dehydrogenase [Candidatus Thermoplasmatota archaeon]
MMELPSEFLGLRFEPPLILASGVLDQTAGSMERLVRKGMGGVVTKSVGIEPREGHPNPTVVELETGLLNAMGLPNPGIDSYAEELKELDSRLKDTPVIGSVFASNTDDFVTLAEKMTQNGADAVELNLSCPHAEGYGASIASDQELMAEVIREVKSSISRPLLAKLPPSTEIDERAKAVEDSGADGIVCINTVRAMAINFETRSPILGNQIGGYSGKGIKPIGLRCVYEVYEAVDIPIIGCGGVTAGRDALEYVLAGASAIQMGSALHHRGKDAVEKISDEMIDLMKKEDIGKIEKIIGDAHQSTW